MKKKSNVELDRLWRSFSETGRIGAYMTYKAVKKRLDRERDEGHS